MIRLPSGPLLLDTGIYIRSSRGEAYVELVENTQIFGRTILTAVVAAELCAATRSHQEKRVLDEFCRTHQAVGRFSTPPAEVWMNAGITLRRAKDTLGQLPFAHHFRDVLIALEAARAGATLIAENARDFERWKTLLASAGKKLKLFDPS